MLRKRDLPKIQIGKTWAKEVYETVLPLGCVGLERTEI